MNVLEITTYGRNTLRRRRRELRIIDPSSIPSLAPAFEVDPAAPTATLVSEDLPAITLADLISISPLPAAAVLHALQDVARILHAMHACGLVHGDLRPSTIYVMPDGRAALARPGSAPPGTGTSHDSAQRADAYGFAVLAIELLTGVRPVDHGQAISMATALPLLPGSAAKELKRALTADPSRRPLPLDLVDALAAVPAEEWETSHQRRTPKPPDEPPKPIEPVEPPKPTEPDERLASERWAPETGGEAAAETPEPAPAPEPERQPDVAVRIVPPRPRRTLFRRILGPFVILLGLMTVVAGGAVGAAMLFAPTISAGDAVATPLQVRRVSLSATPPQAFCPRASFHFAATIVTDGGAGKVEVRWLLPDGITADPESFSVDDGRNTLRAALDLTLAGTDRLVGKVVAVVSPAGVRASVPIRYLCPAAPKERRNTSRAI